MPFVLARTAFTGGIEITDCLIAISEGKIISVSPLKSGEQVPDETVFVDCLAPGFIDIHINGGEEFHFTQSPTQQALEDITSASHRIGTFYTLPTCITSSWENIREAISTTRRFIKENPQSGVLGIHIEGPFINQKKRGAHPASLIQTPSDEMLEELIQASKEIPVLLTVAPELFEERQLEMLRGGGVLLSVGHSDATYEQTMEVFGSGVNLCTHLYNAMSAFGHRQPGIVGAVFNSEDVYAPIIVDGIHCNYGAARVAYREKGEKLFLISDALFLGRKKLRFQWGEFDASLVGDRYINTEGNLAGGAISLADAVVNSVREVGIPLAEAIDMVTGRPAAVLGREHDLGQIAPGYPAVFTSFSSELSDFNVLIY